MPDLVIFEDPGGEWSALYVDGRLEKIGDHYVVNEFAFELAKVQVIQDDAFLRGGDGVERNGDKSTGPARTLEEIEAYRHMRDDELRKAASARAEAELLLAAAAAVEARYKR